MMKNKIISIIGAFCLVGCATVVVPQQQNWKVVKQDVIDNRNYTVGGIPLITPVGSTLIRRQKYTSNLLEHGGYVVASNDFSMRCQIGYPQNIKIKGNVPLEIAGKTFVKKTEYLAIKAGFRLAHNGMEVGFVIDPITYNLIQGRWALNGNGGWIVDSVVRDTTILSPIETTFKKATRLTIEDSGPYINYEIVYSGINNKTINLMYREYDKKDFARTAFFQNLTYTLKDNEPTMIRFQDLEIKVIKAGNEGIEFAVLKDDSTP
jgi:hypothetical protein